jgi:hypothetical protein
MKNKTILIRLSDDELKEINFFYKRMISKSDSEIISKSEFIRRLIKSGIEDYKNEIGNE